MKASQSETEALPKSDRSTYTPTDFLTWREMGMLEISPKFQRRPVWRTPARSYFIDTILRGMAVPPIYFRLTQNEKTTKAVREVIDGQQRVRSVLDFCDGKYRLSKSLSVEWAGKLYSDLDKDKKKRILLYGFPSETFAGISDQQVLQMFSRLNTNGVQVNKQELRNGRWFGHFKQSSFDIASEYLEFWRNNKIFGEQSIARMMEVELTSELLIAGQAGMQEAKKSIDDFYKQWDVAYPGQEREEKRFRAILLTISESVNNRELAESAFHRVPLFYTLYCVIYHRVYGMPGIKRSTARKSLTANDRSSLRDAILRLSEAIEESKESPAKNAKIASFVSATQRGTEKLLPRKIRFDTLHDEAF
jgi:hypothetical protein